MNFLPLRGAPASGHGQLQQCTAPGVTDEQLGVVGKTGADTSAPGCGGSGRPCAGPRLPALQTDAAVLAVLTLTIDAFCALCVPGCQLFPDHSDSSPANLSWT